MSDAIDTGDYVKHIPTGESWVVACVRGDRLSWSGWPEGTAALSDCVLIQKAAPGERLKRLKEMAGPGGNQDDHRRRYAREVLATLETGES